MSSSKHHFVITGPPGSGKTPLVLELAALGFVGVDEPARAVIAEQRAISGAHVYDRDRFLFFDLMLARAIADFEARSDTDSPVFFDRGIPDLIGYARLFDLDASAALSAAHDRRYNETVFVLPSWADIYTTDNDRRMSFQQADAFGRVVHEIYVELGYTVVVVPRDTVSARARFILETLDMVEVPRHPSEPTFQRDLYKGTAADYDRYRLPYPAELGEWLGAELSLDGSGRLLDLASGTGQVARALRRYFARVVAVEAEKDMVDYGRARSEREDDGIEWRLGRAEDVEFPDESFDVVAAGNAFHRFDRPVVAANAARWLERQGAVALLWGGSPWEGDARWQEALSRALEEWKHRAGAAARVPKGWRREDYPDEMVLRDAGFARLVEHSIKVRHTWMLDDIVGFLRSTSFASRSAMGDSADAFEEAVRRTLLETDEGGTYEQEIDFGVQIARR